MMQLINTYISSQYELKDRFEAGIILTGPEVKSCKMKSINFKGAYCSYKSGDLYIKNLYIAPYKPARREQDSYDPYRPRKLLLHKKELLEIEMRVKTPGNTVVPFRLYSKHGLVKLEIAVAQGLKKYDKREKIKKRDITRQLQSKNWD